MLHESQAPDVQQEYCLMYALLGFVLGAKPRVQSHEFRVPFAYRVQWLVDLLHSGKSLGKPCNGRKPGPTAVPKLKEQSQALLGLCEY